MMRSQVKRGLEIRRARQCNVVVPIVPPGCAVIHYGFLFQRTLPFQEKAREGRLGSRPSRPRRRVVTRPGEAMFDSFDQVKISAVCPKCGYENRKTDRELRAERTFGCFA